MSEFNSSTLKKRRKGQRMTVEQRDAAQKQFLEVYERTANILTAADEVKIDRSLVYYWQEHDEQFSLAFKIADKAANANIEAEIRRRAMDGVEEPILSQGHVVYEYEPVVDEHGDQEYDDRGKPKYKRGKMLTTRKYSDVLLMFYAKRRMPEYREKQVVDLNTTGGNVKDLQTLHEAIARSLAPYPEAKAALAASLMEVEKARGQ